MGWRDEMEYKKPNYRWATVRDVREVHKGGRVTFVPYNKRIKVYKDEVNYDEII